MKKMFSATTNIDTNKLVSVISTAFDGGISYWCSKADLTWPSGLKISDIDWLEDPSFWESVSKIYLAPFVDGGCVTLEESDDDETHSHVLDIAAIKRGVNAMSSQYPRQWANIITDDYDAEDGDIFVQCCIFGKAVYG